MHRYFPPLVIFALLLLPTSGWTAWDDYFPVEAISPGMVGTMYCGFEGGEIKGYPVIMRSVIGNRGRHNDGWRGVLIEAGEELMADHNGFAEGMSGAPIYIGNQLAGAFYEHFEWTLQNVGLMRPIDQMLKLWQDDRVACRPDDEIELPRGEKVCIAGREFTAVHFLSGNESSEYSASLIDDGIMPMKPASTRVVAYAGALAGSADTKSTGDTTGMGLPEFQPADFFIDSTREGFHDLGAATFSPGSTIAAVQTIGDITIWDVGCLTLIDPDTGRFLAFGHEVFGGLGDLSAPLGDCIVYNTFQGLDTNFQLAKPTQVIGTIHTDFWPGAAGILGEIPHMIKVDLTLVDNDYELEINTGFYAADDYRLYPSVISLAVTRAIERGFDVAGSGYVTVDFRFETTGGDIFEFSQAYLAPSYAYAAASDLGRILEALAGNDFREVTLDSITGEIVLTELNREILVRNLRTIVNGEEKEGAPETLKPGDMVDLKLRLEPRMAGGFDRTYNLQVPEDFPTGTATLQIYGGNKRLPLERDVGKKVRTEMENAKDLIVDPIDPVSPVSLEELITSLKPDYMADTLVIQLVSTAEEQPEGDRPNAWIAYQLDGIVTGAIASEIQIDGGDQ